MPDEVMTIAEVAKYLRMNDRTVYRLAQDGKIPAAKIAGQWRFRKDVLGDWLAGQMRRFATPVEPMAVGSTAPEGLDITDVVDPQAISLALASESKDLVLRELVELAEHTGRVKMPDMLLRLLREREALCSTAVDHGVALPHPRYMLSGVVDAPVMAMGRAPAGIPFGAADGQPTRLFLMLCSPNDQTHLRMLSRLARLLSDDGFRQQLVDARSETQVIDTFGRANRA